MNDVARLRSQRAWVFIGTGVLIAAAVALSRLFTTDDPPPIGLYIIVWGAAQAAAGLTIFVGYGQAIRTTAREVLELQSHHFRCRCLLYRH